MTTTNSQALAEFIFELKEPYPQPLDLGGARRFDRTILVPEQPCQVVEVDEETYWYYLEVLPPHYFDGRDFCFAEGFMPYLFFWMRNKRYFVRQLTDGETRTFCMLAGIPLPGHW